MKEAWSLLSISGVLLLTLDQVPLAGVTQQAWAAQILPIPKKGLSPPDWTLASLWEMSTDPLEYSA